jgi:hypothetical protein
VTTAHVSGARQDGRMEVSGLEPDHEPKLDEFLLARIAEDKRIAVDAATAAGGEDWPVDGPPAAEAGSQAAAEYVSRHDPGRVLAECAAKRRMVLACREAGPDLTFLGRRPAGMADFPLTPHGTHELAALTLALLALPYAAHHDYREEWRP